MSVIHRFKKSITAKNLRQKNYCDWIQSSKIRSFRRDQAFKGLIIKRLKVSP